MNEKVKTREVDLKLELPFGNIGNVSGNGMSQFSPLKYILLGNAHPFCNVKEF